MKKCPPTVRPGSCELARVKNLRTLKKCLHELQALYTEAVNILNELLISPSAETIRRLCARFYIVQEYFAMRYKDARAHAIMALGRVDAALSFP